MIMDFFPENALGDGPKNSRIRVKTIFSNSDKSHEVAYTHFGKEVLSAKNRPMRTQKMIQTNQKQILEEQK